jgi:hypothetical protein
MKGINFYILIVVSVTELSVILPGEMNEGLLDVGRSGEKVI